MNEPKPKNDYHETASGEKRKSPYDKPKPRTPQEPMMNPAEMQEQKTKYKPFEKAWDEIIKFSECPVCHGDQEACPAPPGTPASYCPTRRNAMKHMKRGKGSRPARVLRY
jgi:hypothetical protein